MKFTLWISFQLKTKYKGKINGKLLNSKHNEFIKYKIYDLAYRELINKYILKNTHHKLKYLSIDTLFVKNKGIFVTRYDKINKNIGRNKFYKNKRGIKVSTIVDSNGVPLNLECFMGNSNDAKFVDRLYHNSFVDFSLVNKKYKKKSYFLGDKAYDTNNIRNLTKNHITIIDYNKRNTKKEVKKLNKFEKIIYKKKNKGWKLLFLANKISKDEYDSWTYFRIFFWISYFMHIINITK